MGALIMKREKDIFNKSDGSAAAHLARALADGRYDENRAWKYGRKEKRRPNDQIPDDALFGGQYSMSDAPSDTKN